MSFVEVWFRSQLANSFLFYHVRLQLNKTCCGSLLWIKPFKVYEESQPSRTSAQRLNKPFNCRLKKLQRIGFVLVFCLIIRLYRFSFNNPGCIECPHFGYHLQSKVLSKLSPSIGRGCLSMRNSITVSDSWNKFRNGSLLCCLLASLSRVSDCYATAVGAEVLKGVFNTLGCLQHTKAALICRLKGENLHPLCACLLGLILFHTHSSVSVCSKRCSHSSLVLFRHLWPHVFRTLCCSLGVPHFLLCWKITALLVLKSVLKILLRKAGKLTVILLSLHLCLIST